MYERLDVEEGRADPRRRSSERDAHPHEALGQAQLRRARDLPRRRRLRRARQGARHGAGRHRRRGEEVEPARPRRRRLRDRPQVDVPPEGRPAALPHGERRRVRARHVQGPLHHRARPAHAHRGHRDHLLRARHPPRLHLHPRRVREAGAHPREGDRRGARGRHHRAEAPRQEGLRPRDPRAPRRGRLHLRRGVGAARVARGQEGLPAAEAARSRPSSACGASRPSSTTSRRSPTSPGSSRTAATPSPRSASASRAGRGSSASPAT